MTVKKVVELGLLSDTTEIFIRSSDFDLLTHGRQFRSNLMKYMDAPVESFTWQDDNKFYIDLQLGAGET